MSAIDDADGNATTVVVPPVSFATVAARREKDGGDESDRRSQRLAAAEANDVTDRTPLLNRHQIADGELHDDNVIINCYVDRVPDQTTVCVVNG